MKKIGISYIGSAYRYSLQYSHRIRTIIKAVLLVIVLGLNYSTLSITVKNSLMFCLTRCLVKWLEVRCSCPMCNNPISDAPGQTHSPGNLLDDLL